MQGQSNYERARASGRRRNEIADRQDGEKGKGKKRVLQKAGGGANERCSQERFWKSIGNLVLGENPASVLDKARSDVR